MRSIRQTSHTFLRTTLLGAHRVLANGTHRELVGHRHIVVAVITVAHTSGDLLVTTFREVVGQREPATFLPNLHRILLETKFHVLAR